jgi:elongation factor Ts
MIKTENNKSVLVSLYCETDFVSKNEDFTSLLSNLTNIALKDGIEKMKEVSKDMINPIIQKTGENIQLGEAYIVEGNVVGNYIHNHKSAVIVSLEGGNEELAKNIAMHITAMKPEYISQDEISEEDKKTMNEVFEKEVANVDKPEDIKKKILEGKIATYFKEKTLLSQPFIKNADETIGKLLEKSKAKIKEVKRFSI